MTVDETPVDVASEIERWTYTGQRARANGKLAAVFLDVEGDERWFSKFAAQVVGGVYDVRVERTGEGVTVRGTVTFVEASGHALTERWQTLDRAARADLRARQAERRLSSEWHLDGALDACASAYRSAPPSQRAALLGAMLARIMGGGDR